MRIVLNIVFFLREEVRGGRGGAREEARGGTGGAGPKSSSEEYSCALEELPSSNDADTAASWRPSKHENASLRAAISCTQHEKKKT